MSIPCSQSCFFSHDCTAQALTRIVSYISQNGAIIDARQKLQPRYSPLHLRLDLLTDIPAAIVLLDSPEEQGAAAAARFPEAADIPLFLFVPLVLQVFALALDHENAAVGE